jgi:hypothetical protein
VADTNYLYPVFIKGRIILKNMSFESFIENLTAGFWIAALLGLTLGLLTHYFFRK